MAKKKAKKKVSCSQCTGLCCRYMALPIETPEDREDFDDIRWYLVHRGVSVFVEDGDWYLNIENRCKYLSKDHRCKIYDKRPQICRDHKIKDCELTHDEFDYEMYFGNDKQMEEYMKIKFDNNHLHHPRSKSKLKKRIHKKK
ncbi:MAG: YkgJ family cysteine cluster protein [Sedimentisphaerales bacterium]|nr:YkgJ family cysteine cluster protein [Sedimentisphaerales bacterium]